MLGVHNMFNNKFDHCITENGLRHASGPVHVHPVHLLHILSLLTFFIGHIAWSTFLLILELFQTYFRTYQRPSAWSILEEQEM